MADLTTLANVKEWLGQQNVTANDALLSRLISACSEYMQTLMSRTIALSSYAEIRNGMGMDAMMVKNTPLVSVAALTIDGVAIPPRPALGPASSGYGYTFDDQVVYLSGYRFNWGRQNVTISYDAGFATTPPDLEQACIDIIGDWFKYRDRIGKSSESIEGQSISFANQQIPVRTMGVILAYKRVSPVY
jgi:hypothetical protein